MGYARWTRCAPQHDSRYGNSQATRGKAAAEAEAEAEARNGLVLRRLSHVITLRQKTESYRAIVAIDRREIGENIARFVIM
jgi:redox-regulated HSP33 family molecular chaperone